MKLQTSVPIVFMLLVLFFPGSIYSQVYTSSVGHVEFISTAPLNEFKGTSDHLVGLINTQENLVDFYVDLNTIDTGIEKRNRDMRETYLETDDYPFAEFTGQLMTDIDLNRMSEQEVTVTGDFSVHGVTRQIDVNGTLEPTREGIRLEASWVIRLEEYDIERPGILFYELAEEQKIRISTLLRSTETAGEK